MPVNLAVFLIGLLAALALTPLSKRLAARVGAIDTPGELKVHARPMPRFGGSAIWAAVVLACVTASLLAGPSSDLRRLALLLSGATMMALLGAVDDIFGLSFGFRFVVGFGVTLAVSAAVVWLDWGWGASRLIITGGFALWLLGTANALNMLDGLDGLAAGSAAIMALGLAAIALVSGNSPCALLALATAGACLGFLPYNFRPASTFMGDVGSLFLGCALAAPVLLLAAPTTGKSPWSAVLGALVAVGVPVGDMLLAMARRLINRRGLFDGDRGHFYDQLRDRFGFTVVKTVLTVYALCLLCAALGTAISLLPPRAALLSALGTALAAVTASVAGGFVRREKQGD